MTHTLFRSSLFATLMLSASLAGAAGNVEEGKLKAYTCSGCHGVIGYKNAYPNYHVPKIHGQNEAYLIAAINAYKKGERAHPTMRAQGESLSDQDIQDIAAFLAAGETK